MPELSIIVPIYNSAETLTGTVQSVLAQTYQDFELILVDDGSRDNSYRICQAFAATEPRIVVLQQENGGVSSARNAGIEAARGDFITFVDADDYLDPTAYACMIAVIKEKGADICVCGVCIEGEYRPLSHAQAEIEVQHKPLELLLNKQWFIDSCWNKIYRRDLIGDSRFQEAYSYSEDKLFVFELLSKAQRAVRVDSRFYHYIQREKSLSRLDREQTWISNFKVNQYIYQTLQDVFVTPEQKRYLLQSYGKAIISLLRYDIRHRRKSSYRSILRQYGQVIDTFIAEGALSLGKRLEYRTYASTYALASLIHYYGQGRFLKRKNFKRR